MVSVRCVLPALAGFLLAAAPLQAQTGTITGRVVDSSTSAPLSNVIVSVEGTPRRALTRDDGSFTITEVPAGSHRLRSRRIGYGSSELQVTVTSGSTSSVEVRLNPQAAALGEIVVTGYGTQRREAISGSVSTIDAEAANVGVITNVNEMLQGRVAGVQMITNNGEPGAGSQIRIRGGTSISASNEPLYVVDGVPLQNDETTPGAPGIASISPQLSRSPLNSINPDDIESITVLKDASATAIYGSRGANGVILITTKRVGAGGGQMEYETYVAAAAPTKKLGLASGAQYRAFVQAEVAAGRLPGTAASSLGTADTDWEDEITRTGWATNHNLAFSGGSSSTQYRASLNYFDQKGAVIANGLQRYQGRLNATHDAFSGRLRMGLNLMAARVVNDFAPIENTGGFLGGLFTNMAIYNPTFPVYRANGQFFERNCRAVADTEPCIISAQDEKNPVAMARLWEDEAPENRVLGNFSGTIGLLDNLTAQTTLGIDYTDAVRRTFAPRSSPVGAQFNGYARQADRSLQNANFQQLLTYTPTFGANHELEMIGGYEYSKFDNRGFEAQMQGFITDAFGVNNLGAGTQASSPVPTSYRVESQLVSFFSRATYSFADKYFLTGVIRYDGSSRLAPGHRWATFPAVSASWRVHEESFMANNTMLSTLGLRAGYGFQGNQAVAPYQTQLLLRADPGATYPFGNVLTTGLRASQVGNPDLKWETAEQVNIGLDYGLLNDRFTGIIEWYRKNTRDLLLEVDVPQPAVVNTRIENIGSVRNTGVEMTFNTSLMERGNRTLNLEIIGAVERNKVVSLGDTARKFINTGWVSGQGQSGQYSQRIMVGEPLGTFFAPRFVGHNAQGQQLYACREIRNAAGTVTKSCASPTTTDPTDQDRFVIGSANPDFTLGVSNNGTWGRIDMSWLWRGEFGGKVFNNTALVYRTKSNATQGRNFLAAALGDPDALTEPAKYSDRWIEDRTFVRLQNVTLGYTLPPQLTRGRVTRVFVSGDNLLLFSDYSGYDPEVFVSSGMASRGIDYLTYPRTRTFTLGARAAF